MFDYLNIKCHFVNVVTGDGTIRNRFCKKNVLGIISVTFMLQLEKCNRLTQSTKHVSRSSRTRNNCIVMKSLIFFQFNETAQKMIDEMGHPSTKSSSSNRSHNTKRIIGAAARKIVNSKHGNKSDKQRHSFPAVRTAPGKRPTLAICFRFAA